MALKFGAHAPGKVSQPSVQLMCRESGHRRFLGCLRVRLVVSGCEAHPFPGLSRGSSLTETCSTWYLMLRAEGSKRDENTQNQLARL